jgi:hypothetical protein
MMVVGKVIFVLTALLCALIYFADLIVDLDFYSFRQKNISKTV